MSSTIYIPPQGLRFRLVGYISHCAIFSRNSPEPTVGQVDVSQGEHPNQWFTLLHGTGGRSGRYAIKGQVTGKVLYSRKKDPPVGQTDGDGKSEDNWFKIEPGKGQYAHYFRLSTPTEGVTLYSRLFPDPTFSNISDAKFLPDQLFNFIWEDMKVDKVEFNLAAGKILSSTQLKLTEQVLTNDSGSEKEMEFKVNEGVTNSSAFKYDAGFTVTPGMEFRVAIPVVAKDKFEVGPLGSKTWVWGKTIEYNTQYTTTFRVKVRSRQSVLAAAVVNRGTLNVPYTMYLSSKSSGTKVQTTGSWSGASSWDLRQTALPINA